ncbi:MAG: M20/M25/M40 family metallo-hydrolase [Candidatus Heimdallarchaeota archaeon]|nr:M20/M25/M40 family metallo-hydrolase [Candidatus Heimdallarchaeota archaeon]
MTEPIIDYLRKLVSMPSVSADPDRRSDALETAKFIQNDMNKMGMDTLLVSNEVQGLNPLILASLGNDPKRKTLAIYSHYDVQPASIEDGWDTDPFVITEKDGYLYGRGASDDKSGIATALTALKEIQNDGELPINFRFIYEGEEESASGGFEETVTKHRDWLGKIDGILILDTGWFGDNVPAMDYGFRGIAYMGIEIKGPVKDVHSGSGGTFREPLTDLIKIMADLKDGSGKATIEGFYDKVRPVTKEENELYENIEFDAEEYRDTLGLKGLNSYDKKEVLMNTWRHPSISLHGIEGAFSGKGAKTVIPAKVNGKVSMRLVPDQDPQEIANLFTKHVKHLFEKQNSPNDLVVHTLGTGDWWYGDPNNFLFEVGKKVLKEYWNIEPSLVRSGGSIPIVPFMEKTLGAPAVSLGIGQDSDGAHSQNERIRIKNLVGGKEVLKRYFQALGKL